MSVKTNTIANYIGQIYMMLIGIVVTPLYLQYLGAEAYGLVGFFALMQAWMNLLDMGLSPTLGRQAAYARGQIDGFETFKYLVKSFEVIFLVLALIIICAIYFLSDWIALSWIKSETIKVETLVYCVVLMGVMIGFRWFAGLYRSGINGLEYQVWLNTANIILTSLKFLGALFLLIFISQDVRHFFEYQLCIGLIELIIFFLYFYKKLPLTKSRIPFFSFNFNVVRSVAPFALGVAYTASIWILITQTDKLILSTVLTLSEFGFFSLIALLASGVTMLAGPIAQAIMPRLTMLLAQDRKDEMLKVYTVSSQVTVLFIFSLALIIGLYAEPLIYAWTGDIKAAKWGSDILIWFALGNGVLSIGAFQYYLQSAFGQLKLHVIGSTISAIIQVPLIYYAATNHGAVGAGMVWFGFRCIWFFVWTPIVHRYFVPGFHLKWLCKDIIPIIITNVITSYVLFTFFEFSIDENRLILLIKMIVIGLVLIAITSLSVPVVRNLFIKKYLLITSLMKGSG